VQVHPSTANMRSRTYNCTSTSRLTPSCGVYYGFRQPLSLCTALGCITLAKTVLRCLIPVRDAFSWPWAAFARLYRLSTDASSKIYLNRVLCGCWFAIPAPMYPVLHGLRRWNDSERALGKGNLSYGRGAYGVKKKMMRSEWKR
jgi:hypothetical protein